MAGTFAAWLQGEIDRRGLGVAEAGRMIGLSHSMMSDYLNRKRLPSRRSLVRIAAGFDGDLGALVRMVSEEEEPSLHARPRPGRGPAAAAEQLLRTARGYVVEAGRRPCA